MNLDAGPLTAFATRAGLDLQDLQLGDTPERLDRSPDIERERLAAMPWPDIQLMRTAYGDALHLAVDYEDTPDRVIDDTLTEVQWQAYRSKLEPTGRYRLRIHVDKLRLLEQAGLAHVENVTHFFFASNLLDLLEKGLSALEAVAWKTSNYPALILTGDTEIDFSGPLLRVVGGDRLESVWVFDAGLPSDVVANLREAQRELVSIEAPAVEELTPWHLRLDKFDAISEDGERLARAFKAAYAQLCLLALCDRARPGGTATAARLEFRGVERLATVAVDTGAPELRSITDAEHGALRSIVEWSYEDVLRPAERNWTPQRLHFVQVRLARLVGVGPEAERLAGLLRTLAEVDATKEVFWKAFLENTVSDYLDRLRDLEDEIDTTVDTYGERTAGIVEKLTANMLAAVAALIGSFVAAAFRSPFNTDLFRISMRTYAVYLAILPAALGLVAQVTRYGDLDQQFTRRRASFELLLGTDYVKRRVGKRIKKAQWRWWGFFAIAIVVYVGVVVAAWIGSTELPKHVATLPERRFETAGSPLAMSRDIVHGCPATSFTVSVVAGSRESGRG